VPHPELARETIAHRATSALSAPAAAHPVARH
jgi:hypothetical protein